MQLRNWEASMNVMVEGGLPPLSKFNGEWWEWMMTRDWWMRVSGSGTDLMQMALTETDPDKLDWVSLTKAIKILENYYSNELPGHLELHHIKNLVHNIFVLYHSNEY